MDKEPDCMTCALPVGPVYDSLGRPHYRKRHDKCQATYARYYRREYQRAKRAAEQNGTTLRLYQVQQNADDYALAELNTGVPDQGKWPHARSLGRTVVPRQ